MTDFAGLYWMALERYNVSHAKRQALERGVNPADPALAAGRVCVPLAELVARRLGDCGGAGRFNRFLDSLVAELGLLVRAKYPVDGLSGQRVGT
ncbi:hypothetical protein [Klebsiella pneumoniae]|uniref:hypothetical protein n=1 Tax=Klebsiella pneumoniae TaxID=573 RepID=UPI003A8F7AF5